MLKRNVARSLTVLSLLLCACSGSDGETGTGGAGVGGSGNSSSGGTGGSGGAGSTFDIHFDYRFDAKGLFDDPARRAALEAAGSLWASLLADEFANVPAGTEVLSRNPEDPETPGQVFTLDYEIDDLCVFVGFAPIDGLGGTLAASNNSAAIGSVSDPDLQAELSERYLGSDFQPWTGWIAFDQDEAWFYDSTPGDAGDIPAASSDLLSVALHELGHVLGFGASDAFVAQVVGAEFRGPDAELFWGGPVPLSPDGLHIEASVRVEGHRPLMDPSDAPGERYLPTPLDLAMLADVGYPLVQ